MIKFFKSNKFVSILILIMCVIIIINPTIYAKSCLNAISVWAVNILPLLFPFFIFTRLIISLNPPKQNFLDKFFNKLYHCPSGSFTVFFLSTLSGYPMGAKLICTQYENGYISNSDAKKMLSFCSVSGPMFMLGSVGLMMLKSYKAGLIILISNIIASLINGILYRGKNHDKLKNFNYQTKPKENLLADCVYDSLISILMIGAYLSLSFLIIDVLKTLNVTTFLANVICNIFNCHNLNEIILSIFHGFFEMTNGILELSNTSATLSIKTIIASTLIGFGGISVMMQNVGFLNKLKIPVKHIFLQKFTQAMLCFVITLFMCLIFF